MLCVIVVSPLQVAGELMLTSKQQAQRMEARQWMANAYGVKK